jgi:hypothetical protein
VSDFDGTLLTTEGEDVPSVAVALGELPGAVLVSGENAAAGTVASATDPYPTRGRYRMDTDQFDELLAAIQAWTAAIEASALNTGGTVTGPWTPGANDLIQARLEGETVRLVIPDGFTPIQSTDWPGVGGSEPPFDVLPVGLRPTTTSAIGWADTQVFYDQTDSVWVTVAIFVGDNGSVYLVTTDVDATNSLGLGIPHNMTFPLTSPA